MTEPARSVLIINRVTREVVRKFDVTGESDRQVSRLIDGLSINNNHEKFAVKDTAWGEQK